jgi:hypothetical protein
MCILFKLLDIALSMVYLANLLNIHKDIYNLKYYKNLQSVISIKLDLYFLLLSTLTCATDAFIYLKSILTLNIIHLIKINCNAMQKREKKREKIICIYA